MANLALYRKYRPQTFSEFVGQEHIVKTITNQIQRGMISHAYLFSGSRGTGKTTLARLFAKTINCQNRKGGFEPCNQCEACREINGSRAVDIIEIDAASNRGIDEIRNLREGIKFPPTFLKYKVLILDEAHQLTKEAANAILKILEEPPVHAVFILATTEIHKMIPTIISRCQRFDFYKLTKDEITKKLEEILKNEGIKIEKEALNQIAISANGSLRDAESILDQAISFSKNKEITADDIRNLLGIVDLSLVIEFTKILSKKNVGEALNLLDKNLEKGLDVQEFAKVIIDYLRKILVIKINPQLENDVLDELSSEAKEITKKLGEKFTLEELRKLLNLFLEAENKIRYSSLPQLPIELAIIEYCGVV